MLTRSVDIHYGDIFVNIYKSWLDLIFPGCADSRVHYGEKWCGTIQLLTSENRALLAVLPYRNQPLSHLFTLRMNGIRSRLAYPIYFNISYIVLDSHSPSAYNITNTSVSRKCSTVRTIKRLQCLVVVSRVVETMSLTSTWYSRHIKDSGQVARSYNQKLLPRDHPWNKKQLPVLEHGVM